MLQLIPDKKLRDHVPAFAQIDYGRLAGCADLEEARTRWNRDRIMMATRQGHLKHEYLTTLKAKFEADVEQWQALERRTEPDHILNYIEEEIARVGKQYILHQPYVDEGYQRAPAQRMAALPERRRHHKANWISDETRDEVIEKLRLATKECARLWRETTTKLNEALTKESQGHWEAHRFSQA